MNTFKLKHLSVAVALLAGAQGAQALTPWTNGAPTNVIYVSGGAAQDQAFAQVIRDNIAQAGTLDVFGDSSSNIATGAGATTDFGGKWTVYYFTAQNNAAFGALAGQPVAIVKRSLGAAGYGVVPILAGLPLEELNIAALTAPVASGTAVNGFAVYQEPDGNPGTVSGLGANRNFRVVVTGPSTTAGTTTNLNPSLITTVASDAGILGVDAKLLLKSGTQNYPAAVSRVASAGVDPGWPSGTTALTASNITSSFSQISTGGLVYGIAVTSDLYKVLQAAQKRAGTISPTTIGDYTNEKDIPTLSTSFVGSLLAGDIKTWDQVKFVDTTAGNAVKSLTDPTVLADAGVALPTTTTATGFTGQVPVAVGTRNSGAAIGAVAYSTFLNYPWTAGAAGPAAGTVSSSTVEAAAAPLVKQPGGASATGNLLDDWNQGTNNSKLNNVTGAKRWGIAINSADRNASGTVGVTPETAGKQHFRYVRINGYLPKIENVAKGYYPDWAEGVLLYNNTLTTGDKLGVLTTLANGLNTPATAGSVNATIVHTWGQTGIFAVTKGSTANTALYTSPVFDPLNPLVPFSHNPTGTVIQDEVVPVLDNGVSATVGYALP